MSIRIGHASIDENGKIACGKYGDQTGKEVCIRTWYSKPWNVYLECTDKILADRAASYMEQICNSSNYGYCQTHRWTGQTAIMQNGIAGGRGDFDCSSLIITCYMLAGLQIKATGYTGNMRGILLGTGKFRVYTDSKYLKTDTYAKRGGIYLKEGSHVVMALDNGANADGSVVSNPYPVPTYTLYRYKLGMRVDFVKWLQWELNQYGGYGLAIDGKFGAATQAALRDAQAKLDLEVDGKCGSATRKKLILV